MKWDYILTSTAEKQLRKVPRYDARKIHITLMHMKDNPYAGDTHQLRGDDRTYRRRIGSWRILFELDTELKLIFITSIARRGSKTY